MNVKQKTGGLAGVVVGKTAICTVGKAGWELTYRGYSIRELADRAGFEEIAHLLLYGELPDRDQLDAYRRRLTGLRALPDALKAILEALPAAAHPMDVLRTGCSAFGCIEPEGRLSDGRRVANRLLAAMPAVLLYWHHFHHRGQRIETQTDDPSLAGHFLWLLHGKQPDDLKRRAMDASLVLYAEHELAASTFAARIAASTRTDFHSAITSAVGTLRGPLHGGANEASLAFVQQFQTADAAEEGVLAALARKERIMGFGHPVYTTCDPRSDMIKSWAMRLADSADDRQLLSIAQRIEAVMQREKQLFPNLDFYAAMTYRFLGIPVPMFTPVFVCSRLAGWAAHVLEQRTDNKLLRPSAEYIGHEPRSCPPIDQRAPAAESVDADEEGDR